MNCCINEDEVEQPKIIDNNKNPLKHNKKKNVYFNENDNQYYLS